MTVEIIETAIDGSKNYDLSVDLDGEEFIVNLEWNAIDEHWFISIFTDERAPITGVQSMRLVNNLFPLLRLTDSRRPLGEMLVMSDTEGDPGLYTLGTLTKLVYVPKAQIDEWRSTV